MVGRTELFKYPMVVKKEVDFVVSGLTFVLMKGQPKSQISLISQYCSSDCSVDLPSHLHPS